MTYLQGETVIRQARVTYPQVETEIGQAYVTYLHGGSSYSRWDEEEEETQCRSSACSN